MEFNFKEMSFDELQSVEKEYDHKVKDLVIMIDNPNLLENLETLESVRREIEERKNG